MKETLAGGSRLRSLVSGYTVPEGHFDEVVGAEGALRPPWQDFASHAGELGRDWFAHAEGRIARQIHENGVTYNVYAAADGPARPWSLDVLPLLVPAREWAVLSSGLGQRARLLNAIAADIYGAQSLVNEGLLPPALVFGHPGFLPACHGVAPVGGVFLHLLAFDLARGPDGAWRVVGTRTQAPSGVGYALENRATISRLFPDAFRALGAQSLSAFLRQLQTTFLEAAPAEGEAPHAVLLTPGPFNETYSEHAYLAKQLGFPLVEGADLTVRHDRVFLKTVSGLRRVHAILRRLDDDYCDPLEFRSDSALGVAGLVEAWRAGGVLVGNAFGMRVLESPALVGFLPPVCERLLGEPIAMPSLATWWAGEAAASGWPRDGVVKPAFPSGSSVEPVFLAREAPEAQQAWYDRLGAHLDSDVVEEFLPLSHAPVWHRGALESRALMLRVFLLSDGTGGYMAMPGGLARIAGEDRDIVSGQRGGSSKDTWVLSGTPLAVVPRDPHPRDSAGPVDPYTSSRAAEHLFWLGRYAERSENVARLLRAVLCRLTDTGTFLGAWRPSFLRTCHRHGLIDARELPHADSLASNRHRPAIERALIDGMFDRQHRHSLAFNIEQTVRVGGTVRDRLSSDNWRLLSRLSQSIAPGAVADEDGAPVAMDDALDLIDQSIIALVAVAGLEMAHMTRDDGWRFLSIGRHLERLSFVASTLGDVIAEEAAGDPTVLEWLLDLSDSMITHRSRYLRSPEWSSVVELLVFDAHNPRSAHFQLAKLAKHVRLLPSADAGDLASLVADIDRLCLAGSGADAAQGDLFAGARAPVDLIGGCERVALGVSDALTLRYFSHVYEQPHRTDAL
jgi:uncharacterized circularly permuted ATP-grasp superfamily protein/uncharacterized alpha-E superfamily protein